MQELEMKKTGKGTFLYARGRGIVCSMEAGYQQTRDDDAAYIVRACNSFPALVDALRGCQAALVEAGKMFASESAYYVRPNIFELHADAAKSSLEKAGEL